MKDDEGLALSKVDVAEDEMTILELLDRPKEERRGDCSEFARAAYAIFRLAGLKPVFVDVQRIADDPLVTTHLAVGIHLDPADPSRLTTVDLYYNLFSPEGHLKQSEIPAISALSVYHGNRAKIAMAAEDAEFGRDDESIEQQFRLAFRYDPFYAVNHFNYAHFLYAWKDDFKRAHHEARWASKLRPDEQDFKKLARILKIE